MYDLPALVRDAALREELRASLRDGSPPARIRDAKIKITGHCNLRCAFCPCWQRQATVEDLPTAALLQAIDDLAALDCRKIHLSGGEPTLRADLPALIARAAGHGMKVALTTNGTRLTAALAERLLSAGLHSLSLSLDSTLPEEHDALRGVPGAHARVMRGLEHLRTVKRMRKEKTRIRLNMVLTRENYHRYPEVLAVAGHYGATDVVPLPVDEGGKSARRLLPWQLDEYNRDIAPAVAALRARYGFSQAPHLIHPFGVRREEVDAACAAQYARGYYLAHRCYAPWLTVLINWDGGVWPCCMTRGKIPALGSLRESTVRDIWRGDAYQAFRHALQQARLPLCHRCDNYLAENQYLEPSLK